MHNKKGFTIIELIVVIAIIAILAAIVMVNVMGYIQKAKRASVASEISSLQIFATDQLVSQGTLYAFCVPSDTPAMVTFANSITGNGYNFTCSSGDGNYSGTGSNSCYPSGTTQMTSKEWYILACNKNDNTDCFCIDYNGVSLTGSASSFSTANANSCACQ